jgi:hypothetical protein
MNRSAAIVPAVTARSCEDAHLGSPAGSGVGVSVAAGERVGAALEGVVLRSGVGVAMTPLGAAQETSIVARSRSRIVRR